MLKSALDTSSPLTFRVGENLVVDVGEFRDSGRVVREGLDGHGDPAGLTLASP